MCSLAVHAFQAVGMRTVVDRCKELTIPRWQPSTVQFLVRAACTGTMLYLTSLEGIAAAFLGHFDLIYCVPSTYLSVPFTFLGNCFHPAVIRGPQILAQVSSPRLAPA